MDTDGDYDEDVPLFIFSCLEMRQDGSGEKKIFKLLIIIFELGTPVQIDQSVTSDEDVASCGFE